MTRSNDIYPLAIEDPDAAPRACFKSHSHSLIAATRTVAA